MIRCWLLAVLAAVLAAADLETQHAFEAGINLTSRWSLTLHSRMRTDPGDAGLYQVRAGPVTEFEWTPRLSLLGGYYYAKQESPRDDWQAAHRYFGGGEINVLKKPGSLDFRSIWEWFDSSGPGFHRWRNRARWTAGGRAAPYGSVELFTDAQGFRSVRYSAGLRWKAARWIEYDVGYFYEDRRASLREDRHMLLTTIHFRPARTRDASDADR